MLEDKERSQIAIRKEPNRDWESLPTPVKSEKTLDFFFSFKALSIPMIPSRFMMDGDEKNAMDEPHSNTLFIMIMPLDVLGESHDVLNRDTIITKR